MGGCIHYAGVLGYSESTGHFARRIWPDAWDPGRCWHRSPFFTDEDLSVFDPLGRVCRRTPGVWGINDEADFAASPPPPPKSDAARELEVLRKVYGSVTGANSRSAYRHKDPVTKKLVDNVDEYVMDRTSYFGGEYESFRAEALAELEANPVLRKLIEPPPEARKKHPDIWEEAQTTFYAWVRRGMLLAFEKAGKKDVSVPATILGGMTEDLKKQLAKVRAQYKGDFKAGGFNPRPMKGAGGYRLGTISEHALGLAVDIDHTKNAHIQVAARWNAILSVANVAAINRTATWKTTPKDLYDHIKAANDGFLKAVADGLKKAASEKKEGKEATAFMLASDPRLKTIGESFINEWGSKGFFNMEWELVKAFHDAGFRWGAVFGTVDIHHFEM
jgi:hypothetical protein